MVPSHTGTVALFARFVGALSVLAFGCCLGGCDERPAQVKAAFKAFVAACDESRGTDAAAILCKDNFDYYERVKKNAMTMDKAQLMNLPIIERAEVLTARGLIPAKDLPNTDGRGIFVAMVNKGVCYFGENVSLGKIKMSKESASGTVFEGRRDQGHGYRFQLEDGNWKIDYQSPDKALGKSAKAEGKQLRLKEDELTEFLVEEWVGDFDPEWWKPVKPPSFGIGGQ